VRARADHHSPPLSLQTPTNSLFAPLTPLRLTARLRSKTRPSARSFFRSGHPSGPRASSRRLPLELRRMMIILSRRWRLQARRGNAWITGRGRLEGRGSVSPNRVERDGLHARFRSGPSSNRNRASQCNRAIRRTRCGFPRPERMRTTRQRCRQSAEAATGDPLVGIPRRVITRQIASCLPCVLCANGRFRVTRSDIEIARRCRGSQPKSHAP
jgi:hypothetical protein